MKTLQCHSKGDKRFSAMYAQVKIGNEIKTIEKWYQESKRDKYGNIPGKGKHVDYMVWNNQTYSAVSLSTLYNKLWELYFEQNPELLEYACGFDDFVDIFKGKSINNQADVIRDIVRKEKSMKKTITFTKMYVQDNRELKKVNDNVILVVRTRNTEDLLDINRQVYRLKDKGYKVILQSPKGNKLPSRALGKYTKEHVNIEIGGLSYRQVIAKLVNIKSMMSHKEYVDVPVYEKSYPSAFDHKIPKTDENNNVVTQTVEKTVYLDRTYTITIYGEYCHNKRIMRLAKSFKLPLSTVIDGELVDPNDQSYLLDGFTEESKELLNLKYEELDENKKAALYKFFGVKGYKVSDYENFLYSSCNISYFVKGELDLIEKVDAEEFMNMLEMFEIPNAYDIIYDLAEKGMLVNLENYPELQHFEEARFYEDSYRDDEEDILD